MCDPGGIRLPPIKLQFSFVHFRPRDPIPLLSVEKKNCKYSMHGIMVTTFFLLEILAIVSKRLDLDT